jgi:hypothetical protein
MHQDISSTFFYVFLISVLSYFGYLSFLANSDLVDGRYALFMDELITFDGVKRILHPKDWSDFIFNIADGKDHRYGRSLWNSISLFSVFPEHLWGEQGQIIAGRMTQVIILFVAFIILSLSLIKNNILRAIAIFTLMVLPFTEYYLSMPKPEPLQLLMIAIFFSYYVKNDYTFGKYWFFMGAAFGTKISVLPIILLLVFTTFLKILIQKNNTHLTSSFLWALLAFLVGLACSIPMLFVPLGIVLLIIFGVYLINHFSHRIFSKKISTILSAFLFFILFYLLLPRISHPLVIWISKTFMNRGHPSDNTNINALSWGEYWLDSWMVAPAYISISLLLVIVIILSFYCIRTVKAWSNSLFDLPVGVVVFFSGLSINVAIIISADRLWGTYLFTGTVLIIIGILSLIDDIWSHRHKSEYKLILIPSYIACILLVIISSSSWLPKHLSKIDQLSKRTVSEKFAMNHKTFRQVTYFLQSLDQIQKPRLKVAISASLFLPESTRQYRITRFYNTLRKWDGFFHIIIFSSRHTAAGAIAPKEGSARENAYIKERKNYNQLVISKGAECSQELCYERVMQLANGGEILILKK